MASKRVQHPQDEITLGVYQDILDEAEAEARLSNGESDILKSDGANHLSKPRGLYKFIVQNLSTKQLQMHEQDQGQQGVEFLRTVVQDEDPTFENTDFAFGLGLHNVFPADARTWARRRSSSRQSTASLRECMAQARTYVHTNVFM